MNPYLALALAITSEVVGTSALKASHGFSRVGPSMLVLAGYGATFYLMTIALKHFSVGTVYAVWSGVGTAAITMIGWLVFRESLSLTAVAGIALIVAGVAILNLAGGTVR
jgi:small multidrug resistance pump